MDEMNNQIFFQSKNIAKMKRFLEGRGYSTETKYGEVNLAYQDCRTIITTNELPFNWMSEVDALAIKARCMIC